MRKRQVSVLLVATVAVVLVAGCTTTGVPVPALMSPVSGTSEPGLFVLGTAAEKAVVGPCTSAATTITATTSSPNSDVVVAFSSLVDGQYEEFERATVPAGTGSAAVVVPGGCYRVSLQSARLYCDGSVTVGFSCPVVLPPTYQFTYTVTF